MRAPLMLMMSLTNVLVCGGLAAITVCPLFLSRRVGACTLAAYESGYGRGAVLITTMCRGVVVCDLIVSLCSIARSAGWGPGRRRAPHYLW